MAAGTQPEGQLPVTQAEVEKPLFTGGNFEDARVQTEVLDSPVKTVAVVVVTTLAIKIGVGAFLIIARVIAEACRVVTDIGSTGGDLGPVTLVERAGLTGPIACVDLRDGQCRRKQDQGRDKFVRCVGYSVNHRCKLLSLQL